LCGGGDQSFVWWWGPELCVVVGTRALCGGGDQSLFAESYADDVCS